MNIFLSFSGEARQEFAIKFLNFFNKFGISCWYDQHELFLGDFLTQSIIDNGINKSKYSVLIVNDSFLNRSWPCEEAKILYQRSRENKEVTIFPILLDISKEDVLHSKIPFILNVKYQFLHTGEKIDGIAFQILNRILQDELLKYKISTLDRALQYYSRLSLSNSINIYNALSMVKNFEETSYKERSVLLICLIKLLNKKEYEKIILQISYLIYENKTITFDMYKIVESVFLINLSDN